MDTANLTMDLDTRMSIKIDLSEEMVNRVTVIYNADDMRWTADIKALQLVEALRTAFQAWSAHTKRGEETLGTLTPDLVGCE